jgi:hypothetical protein
MQRNAEVGLFTKPSGLMLLSQAFASLNEYEIVIYKSNDFLSLAICIMLWHVKLKNCKAINPER